MHGGREGGRKEGGVRVGGREGFRDLGVTFRVL